METKARVPMLLIAIASILSAVGGPLKVNLHSVPGEYGTIQAAINAAKNEGGFPDLILIAAGDYYEQLIIRDKTDLSITGGPGVVLHATASLERTLQPVNNLRPVLGILRSRVTLTGLTFAGDEMGSAYLNELQGVFFAGSSGTIENCTFRDFRGPTLTDYSAARGLVIHNPTATGFPEEINVLVRGNTFEGNEFSIVIGGDDDLNPARLRVRFTVEQNTIKGFGPAMIAADGIDIVTGASGIVRGNMVSDFQYTGTEGYFSSGIAAFDAYAGWRTPPRVVSLHHLRFEANILKNNDEHLVILAAPGAEIANNVLIGSGALSRWGGVVVSGTNVVIENNDLADMAAGIFLFANDPVFPNWPAFGTAHHAKLSANWFSNVDQLVRVPPTVTGLDEQGTRIMPFGPEFKSITKRPDRLHLRVRNWHDQPFAIQSSTDLRQWTPLETREITLPLSSFEHPDAPYPNSFYRLVTPSN